LYGVFFFQNEEIKRILTDYVFEGHPLRKIFHLAVILKVAMMTD